MKPRYWTPITIAALAVIGLCGLWIMAGRGDGQIAPNVEISGIEVGNLTAVQARNKLRRDLEGQLNQPVTLSASTRKHRLRPRTRVEVDEPVAQALKASEGGFISRGWREITDTAPHRAFKSAVIVDHRQLDRFVAASVREVARPAHNASVRVGLTSIRFTAGRTGRRARGEKALRRQMAAELGKPAGKRSFLLRTEEVPPKVSEASLRRTYARVITVNRSSNVARLLVNGRVSKTYKVSVGQAEYPTPTGRFAVQSKQVDPVWSVPKSEWAGSQGGQVIPPGPDNPLKERWIGFSGSVGFHGTDQLGNLGGAASHGCVRMAPPDVIDLYKRISIGTPVVVS